MKKVLSVLFAVFAVGIASLLLFTPADTAVYALLQRFVTPLPFSKSVVLVTVDDESLSYIKTITPDARVYDTAVLYAREFGARACIFDQNQKSPMREVESFRASDEVSGEREAPFFNLKIVFPSKTHATRDTKSPDCSGKLRELHSLPASFSPPVLFSAGACNTDFSKRVLHAQHFVVRAEGAYYGELGFAATLSYLGAKNLKITNAELAFEREDGKHVRIPRTSDGSVIVQFPNTSWREYNTLSLREILQYARAEQNLFDYIFLMNSRGLFGELNSESPVSILEKALSSTQNVSTYTALKQLFYRALSAYLSGNQERILLDSASDTETAAMIQNSFAICRHLFAELESERAFLREKLSETLCVFALTSEFSADFCATPGDSHFPTSALPAVVANMVLSERFADEFSPFASLFLALVLCVLALSLAPLFRRPSALCAFSVLFVLFVSGVLVGVFALFHCFIGFATPLTALILLLIALNCARIKEDSTRARRISDAFSQGISHETLREIQKHPNRAALDGEKQQVTLLSCSIYHARLLPAMLNEMQLAAFLNYYLSKVSAVITARGGVVESYTRDEVLSLFGAPLADEQHCAHAMHVAFALKACEKTINADVATIPRAPKTDGMSDDLYTAFFILNHHGAKVQLRLSVFTGRIACACLGSSARSAFRIIDGSERVVADFRSVFKKTGISGILANETAVEALRDDYIIRKLGTFSVRGEKKTFPVSEVMAELRSDDEKLWNYVTYWNQAMDLHAQGEDEKARALFKKLSEGRPSDRGARYFINQLNGVEC